MDKEYYLISLNHNDSSNPMKLEKIIFKGMEYPFETEDNKEIYEDVPILAVKSTFGLRDVITREVIIDSTDGKTPELSYNRAVLASRSEIIRITNIYKNMSDDDISRYIASIKRIKDSSRFLYERDIELEREELRKESVARDFLLNFYV